MTTTEVTTIYSSKKFDNFYFCDLNIDDKFDKNSISLYILEASHIDICLKNTILENYKNIFMILNDYLLWKKDNKDDFLDYTEILKDLDLKELFKITTELIDFSNHISRDRLKQGSVAKLG